MIGNVHGAIEIFRASGGVRKNRGQQIVGAHSLDVRRNFLAALKTEKREGARRVPAPTRAKNRRRQNGLLEYLLDRGFMQKAENIRQGETVALAERNVDAVVSGGGLQLQIETTAESFSEREPPRLIDAAAERSVEDELHTATFVEKAFGDDGVLRGNAA